MMLMLGAAIFSVIYSSIFFSNQMYTDTHTVHARYTRYLGFYSLKNVLWDFSVVTLKIIFRGIQKPVFAMDLL